MPEQTKILLTSSDSPALVNHLLDRIAHSLNNRINPDDVIIIAPDIDFLEQVKLNLLSDGGINILYDAPFKTFGNLVRDLTPDVNIASVSYIRLLLKNTLCDSSPGLAVEGRMPGFRRKAYKLFEEFRQAAPSERGKLMDILVSEYPDGVSENGLIKRIVESYRVFENQLNEKNIDTQDSALFKACEKLNSDFKPDTVFIIGFNCFTPPQMAFIRALSDVVNEIIIALPVMVDSADDSLLNTKQNLLDSGFEQLSLKPDSSNIQPDLKLLDSNRNEAEFIARKSAELIESGIKPSEIIVIHPKPRNVLSLFESTFGTIGIPMKTMLPVPLKEISPVREILAILGLLDGDLDSAMSLLSSHFAQDIGLVIKQLDKKIIDSFLDGNTAAKPDSVDSKSWEILNSLFNKTQNINSFNDFKNVIQDIIAKCLKLPDEMPLDYAGMASTSLRTFHSLLDELDKLNDEHEPSDSIDNKYSFFLNELMDQVRSSIVRPRDKRRQAVEFTGLDNVQMKSARVVFLAGMNDVNFPTRLGIDPLLGETARVELHDMGYPFETQREIIQRENFLLRIALELATDYLCITVPTLDERGETNEISPPLFEIYPSGWESVGRDEAGFFTWDDLITKTALFFSDDATVKSGAELQQTLAESYPRSDRALNSNVSPDSALKPDIAKAIGSNIHSFSASALNKYTRCPFIYFTDRILNLPGAQTSLEQVINPLVRGSAIHELLSYRISNKKQDADLVDILKKQGIEIDDLNFIEEAILKDYIAIIEIFIQTEVERIADKEREVLHTEYPFGIDDAEDLIINIDGKDRRFTGVIDRIDKLPDGTFTVVDYKISSQSIKNLFEEAAKFQLPLYAIALEYFGQPTSTAEIVSLGRKKMHNKSTDDFESEEESGIEEFIKTGMENIKSVVRSIESADFPVAPPERNFCGWNKCAYYHICRIHY